MQATSSTSQEHQCLNRALRTLSGCNRALLRAEDEASLLQEICRVIVEEAGYRLAWVGRAEHDATKTVTPIAHAGVEQAYVESLNISWADNERGRGTSGTAIRTGRLSLTRNLLTDPNTTLWREGAIAHGIASVLSFPLRVEGEIFGVLGIGAPEPDAFGPQEVELLTQAAEDLMFGLKSLRTRVRAAEAEATIRRMAYFDALTGLPNRLRLRELLEDAIASAKQGHWALGLLHLEVGRSQAISEALGYREGDRLQQAIAARLVQAVGARNTVARIGECEYAVLMPSGGAEQTSQLAQKILVALYEPIDLSGLYLDARANIGIALYPGHGTDPDALIHRAGSAMDQAKRSSSGYALFQGGLDRECAQHLTLMSELRRAIDGNQLLLYFQPKLQIATNTVCGSEALVRWQHPQHGLLPPNDFIKLAENAGLITPLTYWVLDAALGQSYAWHQEGDHRPVSVNLSAHDLRDPKLIERIRGAFSTWGAEPNWIEFELTESALMEDPVAALETLTQLRNLDSRLTIDDFGTGYSSLAYLQKLPVDSLKIDQSFVIPMLSDDDDSAKIVRSIVELAHNLELKVVAEGVENQETLNRLGNFGCDIAQGFSISRPLPGDSFRAWEAHSTWH